MTYKNNLWRQYLFYIHSKSIPTNLNLKGIIIIMKKSKHKIQIIITKQVVHYHIKKVIYFQMFIKKIIKTAYYQIIKEMQKFITLRTFSVRVVRIIAINFKIWIWQKLISIRINFKMVPQANIVWWVKIRNHKITSHSLLLGVIRVVPYLLLQKMGKFNIFLSQV